MSTSEIDAPTYLELVTPQIRSAVMALKVKYDTRALVAVLAMESAEMYQSLKAAGIENELSIKRIYKFLEKTAQETPPQPPLVIEV